MGAKVIGASSMGALRASELYPYGMEGAGRIYELYKSGKLVSDDEVALIFDPVSFEPLSEPLVNIRYHLQRAEEEGIIGKESCERILAVALGLYFPERNYGRILDDSGLDEAELERFRAFIQREENDLKRLDAIEALKRIKEVAGSI